MLKQDETRLRFHAIVTCSGVLHPVGGPKLIPCGSRRVRGVTARDHPDNSNACDSEGNEISEDRVIHGLGSSAVVVSTTVKNSARTKIARNSVFERSVERFAVHENASKYKVRALGSDSIRTDKAPGQSRFDLRHRSVIIRHRAAQG
jgi:hypothetical protein